MALRAPCGDRRVVHRAVEREVQLDVVLEPVDLRTLRRIRSGPRSCELVDSGVGDRVPVAGRRLRHRAVRPELGNHAAVVAEQHDVRFVRRAGHRVDRVADGLIGAEHPVALNAR